MRLLPSLMILLSAGLYFSCSDELEPPVSDKDMLAQEGYISIQLECSRQNTRAVENGVDALNENLINSVTICLSPVAGDRTDEDAPVYMETFTGINKNNSAIIRIPMTTELITRLFNENNSGECRVFAAVNVAPGDAKTIADLRKLTVNSTFASRRTQTSFTMDGDGTVSYMPNGHYAVGEVKVQRSAAKITLALDVDDAVEETINGETRTWTPNLEGMRVRLEQGVKTSTLDPKPTTDMDDDLYFNTSDDIATQYRFNQDPEAEKYDRVQDIPFYTYPNVWTGSVEERHATFMMLSVPWSSDGGRTWRLCYYHVPIIPFDQFELVRNMSYHVNLHVGVLGSFVPDEPLEIQADYFVADWGEESIDVDILDFRYLVVDQNEYTVNNESSISIPFYTSHKTEVVDAEMTFYRYNFSDQGTEFAVTCTKAMNDESMARVNAPVFTATYNNDNNTLNVSHDLKIYVPYDAAGNIVDLTNNVAAVGGGRKKTQTPEEVNAVLNRIRYFRQQPATAGISNNEYSRVQFRITVQHSDVYDGTSGIDKNLYKEVIVIDQFPGMYITAVENNSDLLGKEWSSGAMGNTIINGRYDYTVTTLLGAGNATRQIISNYTNWDYSIGLSTDYQNWNPNLYLITITKLDDDVLNDYKIDDPRSYYINNNLNNDDVDAEHLDPFPTEYWAKATTSTSGYYNITQLKNPTQAQINTILNGRVFSTNASGNPECTWNQGFRLQGFITAPALNESAQRTLRYYYPTREAEENTNTIAPKFRICSSYGGTSPYLTREMARRRAAAYQELGYAAGRWRLPTFGEVKFVMDLAQQYKIPRLFGRDTGAWYYWCAQGAVLVPRRGDTTTVPRIVANPAQNGTPSGGSSAVTPFTGNNYRDHARFVYDEWYWGDETLNTNGGTPNQNTPIYQFTWGDKLKTNPQPQNKRRK